MFYGAFVGIAPTKLLRHNKSTFISTNLTYFIKKKKTKQFTRYKKAEIKN